MRGRCMRLLGDSGTVVTKQLCDSEKPRVLAGDRCFVQRDARTPLFMPSIGVPKAKCCKITVRLGRNRHELRQVRRDEGRMRSCIMRLRDSQRTKNGSYRHPSSTFLRKKQMSLEPVTLVKRRCNVKGRRLIRRATISWHKSKSVLVHEKMEGLCDRAVHKSPNYIWADIRYADSRYTYRLNAANRVSAVPRRLRMFASWLGHIPWDPWLELHHWSSSPSNRPSAPGRTETFAHVRFCDNWPAHEPAASSPEGPSRTA